MTAKSYFSILALVLLIFSAGARASAAVLVISDIDDTIKETHVQDWRDALHNSHRTNIPFIGMNSLLRDLQNAGAKIVYLSEAPKVPMEYFAQQFLWANDFPAGDLLLSNGVDISNFKLKTLRPMLQALDPSTTVILLGDNGQHDPETFATVQKEFANRKILVYIRQDYNPWRTGPFAGQSSFVTSAEVGLALNQEGILANAVVLDLLAESLSFHPAPPDEDGHPQTQRGLNLPDWVDCTGHRLNTSGRQVSDFLIEELNLQIQARCP